MSNIILKVLLACLLALGACKGGHKNAWVIHVIDGDTVIVRMIKGEDRVRIAMIDTPELAGKCPAEITKAGAARDHLSALLRPGDTVTLTPLIPNFWRRDKYGRLLAHIKTGRDVDVGAALRQAGLAALWLPFLPKPDWCGGAL